MTGDYCPSCGALLRKYKPDGVVKIYHLAKADKIFPEDILDLFSYRIDKTTINPKNISRTLKRTLRIAGFSGEFIKNYSLNREANLMRYKYYNASNACENCGGFQETLTPHHKLPLAWGGEEDIKNIIFLCDQCHSKFHKLINSRLTRKLKIRYLKPHAKEIFTLIKDIYS